MLNAISGKHCQFSVVPLDGNRDVVFSLRGEKEALDTRAKLHCAGRLANIVVSLFEGTHPCNAVIPRPRRRNPQAAKSRAAEHSSPGREIPPKDEATLRVVLL